MRFGLEETQLDALGRIFPIYPKIRRVVLFGSRVRGLYQKGSDIDLAVYHDGLNSEEMNRLRLDLDELPVILKIDLVDMARVERPALAANIERDGVVIYEQ